MTVEAAVEGSELRDDSCGEEWSWWALRPETNERRVQLWTVRRTPFETDQTPEQKCMVRKLVPRLRQLGCGEGERLHAVFTSDETKSRQPDAENITLYNFGSRPFDGGTNALWLRAKLFARSSPAEPARRCSAVPPFMGGIVR